MLEEFVAANREEIIRRCKAKVATRAFEPQMAAAEVNHGVPLFLDQLVETLRSGLPSNPAIGASALLHGRDLMVQGLNVSQVVHDYGDICQSITEMAVEAGKGISADDFRMLNQCLDDAIASAVTEFGRVPKPKAVPQARIGAFQELRTLNDTALSAFEAIKTGTVGVVGSTASVLQGALAGMSTVIDRSLAEESERAGRH